MSANHFFSPAKINIFLQVFSKRDDGFHNLQTLMQTISFWDILSFEEASCDHFESTAPDLPWDETNTLYRALYHFRKRTRIDTCFSLFLEKHIPCQAGLGGGSSNAATLLWALNTYFDLPLSLEDLRHLGSKIGSDVPFFLSYGQALCRGRGEEVTPTNYILPKQFWIASPSFGLSTKEVYAHLQPRDQSPQDGFKSHTLETLMYQNDLEQPAFTLYPKLKKIKEELLSQGFEKVVLSGSGSTFFCVGDPITKPSLPGLKFSLVKPLLRPQKQWYTNSLEYAKI